MFTVIEIQTNGDSTTVVTPIPVFSDINKAYQKFYQVLAAAAVSKVEIHSAAILNEKGDTVRCEFFEHKE